jgi:hypothetical protein
MTQGHLAYEPITDWSREGRRRLVEVRGAHLWNLLDEAFTRAIEGGLSLANFRFHGEDPVPEAVEWCIARFEAMDLDPGRLHPESRSLRLFTEVGFWLAQREGAAGYRRATRAPRADEHTTSNDAREDADDALDRKRQSDRVREGLKALRDRCCASLVAWWLEGAADLRRAVFAPHDDPGAWSPRDVAEHSPKARSFHIADALFRYYALFAGLVRDHDDELTHRACVLTWFSPCGEEPPYEVSREVVRAVLHDMPSRQMTTLRHEGVRALIRQCTDHAVAARRCDVALDQHLARASLRASVLHRFKVDDEELSRRIKALPKDAP